MSLILKGKYAEAIVFTEVEDQEAISQIINILNQPMMEGVKVRVMPDVHAGAGICIGYTATLNQYIVPNFIGVDIGCGLTALALPYAYEPSFADIDKWIRGNIPVGQSVYQQAPIEDIEKVWRLMGQYFSLSDFFDRLETGCKVLNIDFGRVKNGIGTLGGGNHFISINKNSENCYYLTVHSGSRNFGKCTAEYHQKRAKDTNSGKGAGIDYLEGRNAQFYVADAECAQLYAALNRRVILYRIATNILGVKYRDSLLVESMHNYINFTDNIIRKGAISAQKDEKVLIPLSMADGILYGKGKGNIDWNCSAPHGAGRLMSRSKAKQTVSLDEYKKRMEDAGVWTSCVNESTIDESPQAYKDPVMIMEAVKDTVDVVDHWKEVYNYKAGS